jgi:hypothetical protein
MALFHRPIADEPGDAGQIMGIFHIRASDITFNAKARDRIIRADFTIWVVDDYHLESFLQRYRFNCHKTV